MAEHLLGRGHSVATFSRAGSELTERLSREAPETFRFYPADASDADALRQVVTTARAAFGRIDALVNNAGVAYDGVLAMARDQEIDQMLSVNLRAALVLARECARVMLLQRAGRIINITSIIGERGFSGLATYSATKAGIIGMTRSLARELGSRGILVNAIAPGYLDTEMSKGLAERQRDQIIRRTPLGRLGRIQDVLGVLDFLLDEASAFMTGQVLTVDGGSSL
jgi:3-oxoacyl-[acyl-carrier protein] reductase